MAQGAALCMSCVLVRFMYSGLVGGLLFAARAACLACVGGLCVCALKDFLL